MKNKPVNTMKAQIAAKSVNEALARAMLSAFIAPLDPDISELTDLRTAISEAVTNAVIHGYGGKGGQIFIAMSYDDTRTVKISVRDKGIGMDDVKKAMQPLFTTDKSGERGGMGFAIMKSFTDRLRVTSRVGKGTAVTMSRRLSAQNGGADE